MDGYGRQGHDFKSRASTVPPSRLETVPSLIQPKVADYGFETPPVEFRDMSCWDAIGKHRSYRRHIYFHHRRHRGLSPLIGVQAVFQPIVCGVTSTKFEGSFWRHSQLREGIVASITISDLTKR